SRSRRGCRQIGPRGRLSSALGPRCRPPFTRPTRWASRGGQRRDLGPAGGGGGSTRRRSPCSRGDLSAGRRGGRIAPAARCSIVVGTGEVRRRRRRDGGSLAL